MNLVARVPQRTVLVVDDDRKIVQLVRAYLERDGHRVVAAHDGRAALSAFTNERPDLVVLDIMLPALDGYEVTRRIRAAGDTPILMLTARSSVPDRIHGLLQGADDYLPKPFSPAELAARVKAILRRARSTSTASTAPTSTPEPTLHHADLTIDPARFEVRQGDQIVPLTNVEFRLLATLIEADGRVLTRDQLLDAVYGHDEGEILDRTIDVHVGRLRDKLGDRADRPRYVATVRGVGYRAAPA
ncbi:MAG: response regulator transcription factor [Solirubrobacterales bacterium]